MSETLRLQNKEKQFTAIRVACHAESWTTCSLGNLTAFIYRQPRLGRRPNKRKRRLQSTGNGHRLRAKPNPELFCRQRRPPTSGDPVVYSRRACGSESSLTISSGSSGGGGLIDFDDVSAAVDGFWSDCIEAYP